MRKKNLKVVRKSLVAKKEIFPGENFSKEKQCCKKTRGWNFTNENQKYFWKKSKKKI